MANIEDFLELPHEVGQDNFYFNQTKGEREREKVKLGERES